jgi:uncharacterized protein (TIGR02145 family)
LQNYLIANGYNWDGTTTGNKIGKSLAAKTDWTSDGTTGNVGNDITGNNRTGFSALPGGYRDQGGNFYNGQSSNGFWWSATEYNTFYAYGRSLYHSDVYLLRDYYEKGLGFPVRLVRD